jgi:hypothetical protein
MRQATDADIDRLAAALARLLAAHWRRQVSTSDCSANGSREQLSTVASHVGEGRRESGDASRHPGEAPDTR